mmetsp:Transcript_136111/g.271501  ORF Transcript_136111/g.271501 Transcript_136111/m.271501 type:complete len:91 (+) Transcript_136111:124-396(+)
MRPIAVSVQRERENCCQHQPAAACCNLLQQAAAFELVPVRNISVLHQRSAAVYRRYCDPIVSFAPSTWQVVAAADALAGKLLSTYLVIVL